MDRFRGRVALVTGASSGLGAAIARQLARQGAAVALLARRTDRLDALAHELTAAGGRALALPCDVTRDADVTEAVARTRQELGPIAVAVANAAFGVVGRLETLTLADYQRQFETNVAGVLRTVYAVLDDLKRTRGHLVIMGSVTGHVAFPGATAYAMSKFAVRGLAEALGHELAPYGVAVTLVTPGWVLTEFHEVDNRGRRHPGAPHMAPRLAMSAERAARVIVRGVARRRREIVLTATGRAVLLARRLAPGLLHAIIRRFGVASRREPRS